MGNSSMESGSGNDTPETGERGGADDASRSADGAERSDLPRESQDAENNDETQDAEQVHESPYTVNGVDIDPTHITQLPDVHDNADPQKGEEHPSEPSRDESDWDFDATIKWNGKDWDFDFEMIKKFYF